MAYRLGVDLGTTFTAAVILRDGSAPEVFTLGDRSSAVPTVLFIGADGGVLYGEAAERRAVTDPERVVRHFKRRIGDEIPLILGAEDGEQEEHYAHDLAAAMIAWVVARVTEREGEAPQSVALTHPATWGPHKKELLLTALEAHGLDDLTLISEPEAAAISYAQTGLLEPGSTVAVYDFGGGTFDIALLRALPNGRFSLIGRPHGLPDLGGIDFDDLILTHVLGSFGEIDDETEDEDVEDAMAMARLRADCVDAKEALSADTSAVIPVWFAEAGTNVRLTRAEFEELIEPGVMATLETLDRTLDDANIEDDGLSWVLLTGGSSKIPLVTQMLSAHLDSAAQVIRHMDPKLAVAAGAALALAVSAVPAGLPVPAAPHDVEDELDDQHHEDGADDDVPASAHLVGVHDTEGDATTAKVARPRRGFTGRAKPIAPLLDADLPARPAKEIGYVTELDPVKKPKRVKEPKAAEPKPVKEPKPAKVAEPVAASMPSKPVLPAAGGLAKGALQLLPGKLAREAAAIEAVRAALEPVPAPMISGEPGTGRPFLHRRGANRASLVGLEPEVALHRGARAVVPALDDDDAALLASLPVQRVVVPPRPVAPITELLRSEPIDRIAKIEQPPAMAIAQVVAIAPGIEVGPPVEIVSAEAFEVPLPTRPPLEDGVFVDDDYLVETYEADEKRGRFVVITLRRVLALTTLTAAIFAGSGAWVAASSPTVEQAPVTHQAAAKAPK